MRILRKLFSKKKSTVKESAKDVAGLGLIAGGAILSKNANKDGEISGRVNLYHSINKKHVKSALKDGLDGKYSRENPESLSNKATGGKAARDSRNIIYLAKDKELADETGLSRLDKKLKPSTTLKLSIPYDELKKKRTYGNPELDNSRSYEEYKRKGGTKSSIEFKDLSGEKNSKTVLVDGKISAERIKGSKKYQKNSLKEVGKYIKNNPKRFAKGAGKAVIGAGSIMAGTKLLKDSDSDNKVSDNLVGVTAGTLVGSKIINDSNKKSNKLKDFIKKKKSVELNAIKRKEERYVDNVVLSEPDFKKRREINILELRNQAEKISKKDKKALQSFERRSEKLAKKIKSSGKVKGTVVGLGIYGALTGYKHFKRNKNEDRRK